MAKLRSLMVKIPFFITGSLDAPLVVEGKRARKSTEFLSNSITVHSAEKKKIEIPKVVLESIIFHMNLAFP